MLLWGLFLWGNGTLPSRPFMTDVNLEASWLALFWSLLNRIELVCYTPNWKFVHFGFMPRVGIFIVVHRLRSFVKSKDRIGVSKLVGIAVLIAGLIAVQSQDSQLWIGSYQDKGRR